jgi:hypothetical protein
MWIFQDHPTEAYAECDLKVKKEYAEKEAQNYADTRRKVLGDVVCVIDAHSYQNSTQSLENYGSPDHGIVAIKETVLGNFLTIFENYANNQSRKQGVK